MKDIWIFAIGGIAQLLFSARIFIQWIQTEKARSVQSPVIFWQLSLVASLLLMSYGILRDDVVIILGQFISYFVYIRNLQLKNVWRHIPAAFRWFAFAFPLLSTGWIAFGDTHNWLSILYNKDVRGMLLVLGTVGQLIFATRFIFQWYSSEKRKESIFPPAFWIISIVGSFLIVVYGVFRHDPVLILGQATGLIIYVRNLQLYYSGNSLPSIQHDHA